MNVGINNTNVCNINLLNRIYLVGFCEKSLLLLHNILRVMNMNTKQHNGLKFIYYVMMWCSQ